MVRRRQHSIRPHRSRPHGRATPSRTRDLANQTEIGLTFDRRGSGDYADDFVTERPKARVPRPPDPPQQASNDPAPDPPASPISREPDTILVFKDGHKVQVGNYAIVGSNLFDLTPGHRQKVALADLDVNATQKANDDQGVDFKLPSLPGSE